jgi:hypothetical protein
VRRRTDRRRQHNAFSRYDQRRQNNATSSGRGWTDQQRRHGASSLGWSTVWLIMCNGKSACAGGLIDSGNMMIFLGKIYGSDTTLIHLAGQWWEGVGTLNDGYVHNVALPRAPRIQSASHVTCHGAVMRDGSTSLHSTPRVNSTPHHSTPVRADPRIQSASHVPCRRAVMRDGSTPLHSTPRVNSTPLHSTHVQADPRIK